MDQITPKVIKKPFEIEKRPFRGLLVVFLGLIVKTLYSEINYKTLQEYVKIHIIRKFLEGL